jgi:hypothetical protein
MCIISPERRTASASQPFPTDASFAPDLEARLDKAIADKRVWNLHRLVVLRNRRLVLERYFEEEIVRAA